MMKLILMLVALLVLSACNDKAQESVGSIADEQAVFKAYEPSTVDMQLQKISDDVYFVQGASMAGNRNQGFISNAGFVVTGDGVVVFDSLGTPSLAVQLVQLIRSVTNEPIKRVYVSHYHADHIYGLQVFKELGAEIIAASGAQNYLSSEVSTNRLEERRNSLFPWVSEVTRLVYPDRFIEHGSAEETLGDKTFSLNHLGDAHSDADLTMYVIPDKVLFTGDIIFEGRVPFVGSANTKRWLEQLETLEQEEVVALIPGHGPSAQDPNQALTLTREYLSDLRAKMGEAVDELIPFAEAYDAADWKKYQNLPTYADTHRRNAYQVYLSLEQESLN